jgi:acyl carrier protein
MQARLPAMSEHTRDSLTTRVFEILRDEILEVDSGFTPKTNLVEAGLDSLAVTQLMLSIEESTGVWVDESLLTPENLENAEALAALVHTQLASA